MVDQPVALVEDDNGHRFLIYAANSGVRVELRHDGDALWMTQAQMARLIGASALSVYKWESGKVQPRAAQLERILALRKLGKREAAARLA